MSKRDARVNDYIRRAPEYARPILTELREAVHAGCPEVEESIKWGVPAFSYRGMLASMACFKAHCAFRLWKATLLSEEGDRELPGTDRITSVAELPPRDELISLIRRAMELNERGVVAPRPTAAGGRIEPEVPDDLVAALRENPAAQRAFLAFSPSARREYVEWITGAKREATRAGRLAQAVEWIAEGKQRNWKYM